jgi:GxxExxY protein
MHENEIGNLILDCAFEVHRRLGPGLLESTWQACLAYELEQSGLEIIKEAALPVVYKDVQLQCGYRVDLWINLRVIF